MMNDRCIGQYIIMIIGLFQESKERERKMKKIEIYLFISDSIVFGKKHKTRQKKEIKYFCIHYKKNWLETIEQPVNQWATIDDDDLWPFSVFFLFSFLSMKIILKKKKNFLGVCVCVCVVMLIKISKNRKFEKKSSIK